MYKFPFYPEILIRAVQLQSREDEGNFPNLLSSKDDSEEQ